MKYYYGIESQKIDITDKVKANFNFIPSGDLVRDQLFGDPVEFQVKFIFIEHPDGTISKFSQHVKIKVFGSEIIAEEDVFPVIVSVAKLEANYFDNLKIYYGTKYQKIDITDKVKANGNFIPSKASVRDQLFGDPVEFQVKYIFINENIYPETCKIYIDQFNQVYRVDDVPQDILNTFS